MTHNQVWSGPSGSTDYSDMVFGDHGHTIVAAAFEGVDTWNATTGKRTAPLLSVCRARAWCRDGERNAFARRTLLDTPLRRR